MEFMKSNTSRAMIPAIFAAAASILSVPGCTSVTKADPVTPTATVLRAVDGDTIDVSDDSRGRLRIRLIGIDSPELNMPKYGAGIPEPHVRKYKMACFSQEASEYARTMLVGQRVALESDPSQDRIDRWGRTLAFVILAHGRNFSVESARGGYARSYVFAHRPSKYAEQIADAQRQAQESGRGLWGKPCFGETPNVPVDETGDR